ncbi:MAG: polymer-forming cytoskeletal protein [Bryobacteraceae bacterium]|nr:polymer-forming cytoskeletal protein [Bryobacteraceae bacterium]MDW8378946.1 polymer-forming cytoskeletal protein [Bryobacterales bacterium]
MWSRRKEEEYTPRTSNPTPSPAEAGKELGSPSSPAHRMVEPEPIRASANAASIGKSVVVKGNIISREDLYFDGELEGTVELQEHRLTIGPNGRVQANVKAREIVILGTIHGNVEATDKIEIRKEAKLVGDIRTSRIVIEDGAFFKGSIDIVKPEVSKPQPGPQPAPSRQQVLAAAASVTSSAVAGVSEAKR